MRYLSVVLVVVVVAVTASGCGSLIVTQKSVETLRDRPGFTWATFETAECAVFAEEGSMAASKLPEIAEATIEAKHMAVSTLEAPPHDDQLTVFLVESRARMKDLVGRETNATGYSSSDALCVVWPRSGASGLRHETVHIVAMNAWGVPERWINEGLAVDLTGPWIGRDVDAVCKVLRDDDELPSLSDLTKRFNSVPSAVSYPAAGSFVRYLRESFGIATVREVWEGGHRSLEASTGRSPSELETAWLNRIDDAAAEGVTYDPWAVTPADDDE